VAKRNRKAGRLRPRKSVYHILDQMIREFVIRTGSDVEGMPWNDLPGESWIVWNICDLVKLGPVSCFLLPCEEDTD
jgi:hypothetical protein